MTDAGSPAIHNGVELKAFFENWLAGPAGRSGTTERVRFGTGVIAVTTHGPRLLGLFTRALPRPLGAEDSEELLSIHIIDGDAARLALPPCAWTKADFGPMRKMPGWSTEGLTSYLLRAENGVAVADWQHRKAYIWLPTHRTVPEWERAAPFRWLFDSLAQKLGMSTLHAGVVGKDGRGVLIAGSGGAGKSTLALTCCGQGLDYVADDYCLLDMARFPVGLGLFTTGKLNRDAATTPDWVRHLPGDNIDDSGEKTIVFMGDALPDRITPAVRIVAMVLPEFSKVERPKLELVSAQAGFRRLAPSTIAQSEEACAQLTRDMAALARAVPVYRFQMPPDPEQCAQEISHLLDRLADSSPRS